MIFRQIKLDFLAWFIEDKSVNPKLTQDQKAKCLSCSSSTLQRYRNDINMLSPYRILPNITNTRSKKVSNTNLDNNSHRDYDLKRHRLTLNDLIKPETNTESINKRTSKKKNKKIVKAGPCMRILRLTINI